MIQTKTRSKLAVLLGSGVVSLLLLAAFYGYQQQQEQQLRFWLGQKLMLDVRYFCPSAVTAAEPCKQAVTVLPEQLQQQLRQFAVGGVVLFAPNLQTGKQIRQLTAQLQQSRADDLPMLVATDQEGGRVARLPEALAPAFPGFMALAATYQRYQTEFATRQGAAQARQLDQLGININFSPSLDVNNNPQNPVIGVRAFGDDPEQVASLGIALARALQQGGVAATLKHFPGHGDTATDSHTGLPLVNHVRAVAETIDLAPFRQAIAAGAARLVMTAHIQYPALDDAPIRTMTGQMIVPPATLSRPILTDILRDDLGFEGVVITDALNMQAVTDAFTPYQAVLHSFRAGSDIALMPISVQSPADFVRLSQLIDELVAATARGELQRDAIEQSYMRVRDLKSWLAQQAQKTDRAVPAIVPATAPATATDIAANSAAPDETAQHHPNDEHFSADQALDLAIASAALTQLDADLPALANAKALVLLLPDADKCRRFSLALRQEFTGVPVQCIDLRQPLALPELLPGTVVIGGFVAPEQSAVELGVLSDLTDPTGTNVTEAPLSVAAQLQQLKHYFAQSRSQGAATVVIALRSPYPLRQFEGLVDMRLASYGYPFSLKPDAQPGAIFVALARLLRGYSAASGTLPVRLDDA